MSISKIVSEHSPIIHYGFYVPDAKAFAQRHHDLYGAGPFVVMENITSTITFRGEESTSNISIITGAWKNTAVEIIQQHSDNHSYLKENGRYGFHHIDFFVSDVKEAIKEFEAFGDNVQMYNFDRPEFPFAYIDARESCGYYIELNQSMDFMSGLAMKLAEGRYGASDKFWTIDDLKEIGIL